MSAVAIRPLEQRARVADGSVAIRIRPGPGAESEPDGWTWLGLDQRDIEAIGAEFGGLDDLVATLTDEPLTGVIRFVAIALGHRPPIDFPTTVAVSRRLPPEEIPYCFGAAAALRAFARGATDDEAFGQFVIAVLKCPEPEPESRWKELLGP